MPAFRFSVQRRDGDGKWQVLGVLDNIDEDLACVIREAVADRDCVCLVENVEIPTVDMTLEMACGLLRARNSFVRGDYDDVWHEIYRLADPTFTKSDPWAKLEAIIQKSVEAQHIQKGLENDSTATRTSVPGR